MTFVIDRLHVQGHVEECKKVYSPDLIKDLKGINSMICEQRNKWISGFKHIVKHMNATRFKFFIYNIFTYYNQIKCEGIVNIANSLNLERYSSYKRKFALFESSDDEEITNENENISFHNKKARNKIDVILF